ncbi:hypothetical protein [Cupriavidus agavae]|uniref:Transmembrane protein n=1 Tax=Cupriavidus agavae TaxID=1001822 RepID=A0A4Q7R8A0_9BURK|nr:hypothetical protein [Cupriavidus agavae]RZT29075.1 hypothetical protein EV147_5037 [Cupriavidus agavae]
MDMREIEQLHAQYAQPALTIDISPSPAIASPSPLRLGNATDAVQLPSPAGWVTSLRALWAVVFAVGAAAMFLIGSSMGKREVRSQNAAAATPATAATAPAASEALAAAQPHEWPQRSNVGAPVTAQQPAAEIEAPASATQAPRIALPKSEAAKPALSAAPPTAAPTTAAKPVTNAAPRAATSQQPVSNRDVKLF